MHHLSPTYTNVYWDFVSEDGGIAVRFGTKEVCVNGDKVLDKTCNHKVSGKNVLFGIMCIIVKMQEMNLMQMMV